MCYSLYRGLNQELAFLDGQRLQSRAGLAAEPVAEPMVSVEEVNREEVIIR